MVKTKWLILPILIALVILPRLSIDFYLPSLPAVGNALNTDDASLQMTLTIFMLGYAFSMLIAGPLTDILGKKTVLLYGLTLYLIATFACASANSIFTLTVARFFQALGGCCGTVIARVMVKDTYSKDEQIQILSHLSAAMAICPLFIPLLGGLLQIYFGWRAVFSVLGFIALILLIISKHELQEQKAPHALTLKTLIVNYKILLTHRMFIGYSLTIGFAWANYFAFTLESPFLLQKVLGYNPIFFGIFLTLTVFGYLLGTQITKRFANSFGWDSLIFIATVTSLGGASILMMLVTFTPLNWESVVLPMMVIMIGVGIIIPCTQGAVMQPFPTITGTASGLFFFIQMLFGTVGGLILQQFGRGTALPMATTIFISSIFLVLFFYKLIWSPSRERRDNEVEPSYHKL